VSKLARTAEKWHVQLPHVRHARIQNAFKPSCWPWTSPSARSAPQSFPGNLHSPLRKHIFCSDCVLTSAYQSWVFRNGDVLVWDAKGLGNDVPQVCYRCHVRYLDTLQTIPVCENRRPGISVLPCIATTNGMHQHTIHAGFAPEEKNAIHTAHLERKRISMARNEASAKHFSACSRLT
jgi:hypothetical protein